MKKIFALSTAFVLTLGCFTGCGDKKEESEKVSSMSVRELNDRAEDLSKAGNTALTEMDIQGVKLGRDAAFSFASDGSYAGSSAAFEENSQKFLDIVSDYYSEYKEHEWILCIEGYFVSEAYCAETFDSDVVGTIAFNENGETEVDVAGKSLNEIKSELEDKYNDMIE